MADKRNFLSIPGMVKAVKDATIRLTRSDGRAKRASINDRSHVRNHAVAVLFNTETREKRIIEQHNIVTNDGDLYYAQRGANETPTNFTSGATFDGIMELYNGASAAPAKANDRSDLTGLVSGSAKAMDATYPKTNDGDGDNTGAGTDVVTYLVSYTTGEANDTGIADVIITNPSPGATEPLLMHAEFGATFDKTSSDTLKVFVNHTLNGV